MTDVTKILFQIESGDPSAAEQLLPLVYDELRKLAAAKLARERPGQTLQATALVHEAFLRLVGTSGAGNDQLRWESRGHFLGAAAEAMRRILVDRARHKVTLKKGGGMQRVDAEIDEFAARILDDPAELLGIHEVLDQLAAFAPRKAELVKLRYFLGCTMAEAAEVLGIAPATAEDDWTYARAWLRRQFLRGNENL